MSYPNSGLQPLRASYVGIFPNNFVCSPRVKSKYFNLFTTSAPYKSHIKSFDFGPCNARGETSGSNTFTSKFRPIAMPFAHKTASESAIENQKRSSANFNKTGH